MLFGPVLNSFLMQLVNVVYKEMTSFLWAKFLEMGLFPIWADGKNFNGEVFCIEISPRGSICDLSDEI